MINRFSTLELNLKTRSKITCKIKNVEGVFSFEKRMPIFIVHNSHNLYFCL